MMALIAIGILSCHPKKEDKLSIEKKISYIGTSIYIVDTYIDGTGWKLKSTEKKGPWYKSSYLYGKPDSMLDFLEFDQSLESERIARIIYSITESEYIAIQKELRKLGFIYLQKDSNNDNSVTYERYKNSSDLIVSVRVKRIGQEKYFSTQITTVKDAEYELEMAAQAEKEKKE